MCVLFWGPEKFGSRVRAHLALFLLRAREYYPELYTRGQKNGNQKPLCNYAPAAAATDRNKDASAYSQPLGRPPSDLHTPSTRYVITLGKNATCYRRM